MGKHCKSCTCGPLESQWGDYKPPSALELIDAYEAKLKEAPEVDEVLDQRASHIARIYIDGEALKVALTGMRYRLKRFTDQSSQGVDNAVTQGREMEADRQRNNIRLFERALFLKEQ